MRFLFKGLTAKLRSSYDPSFIYNHHGWTVHPNPDTESTDACGVGLHLCKRIIDIPHYIPSLSCIYLARYRGKLGESIDKIRVKSVALITGVAWAKLKPIYDDYEAKLKTIYDDYRAKLKTIDDDYEAKLKTIDDDYRAKRKTLYDDYEAKLKTIDDDYEAKLKTLYDDYEAKLRKKFFKEVKLHEEID